MRSLAILAMLMALAPPAMAGHTVCVQRQFVHQNQFVHQKVIAQTVTVAPLVVTVPVTAQAVGVEAYGQQHYYSAQAAYQQRSLIRNEIRAAIQELLPQQPQQQQYVQAPAPVQAYPQPPSPSQQQVQPQTQPNTACRPQTPINTQMNGAPTPPAANGAPAEVGPEQALRVLKKYGCVRCHNQTKSEAGLSLVDLDPAGAEQLKQNSTLTWWAVYGTLQAGFMPPEAKNNANAAATPDDVLDMLRYVYSLSR